MICSVLGQQKQLMNAWIGSEPFKMIKGIRLLALVCACMVFAAGHMNHYIAAAAVTASDTQPQVSKEKNFIEMLTGETDLFPDNEISRAKYVNAVVHILNLENVVPKEYIFSDVGAISEYNESIYTALAAGLISPADEFFPGEAVSKVEAMKIAVIALGYNVHAQECGGYPSGYLQMGYRLKLMDGLTSDSDSLTVDDGYILLFHMLHTKVMEQQTYGTVSKFKGGRTDLLGQVYDIEKIEGIVSATPFNSLVSQENLRQGYISVDGKLYAYDTVSFDMLGLRYEIYVRHSDREQESIMAMYPLYKTVKKIGLDSFTEKDGSRFYYYDDSGKRRKISVSASECLYLYNGKRPLESFDNYLNGGVGKLEFIANNDIVDVVRLSKYDYMNVGQIDTYGLALGDERSGRSLELLGTDKFSFVYDADGNELSPLDMELGTVIRVCESEDGNLISLTVCNQKTAGVFSRAEADSIYINSERYVISDYFKRQSYPSLQLGNTIEIYVDGNIAISAADVSADLNYAYLINMAVNHNLFDVTYKLKLITARNQVEVYTLCDRLIVDDKNVEDDYLYEKLKINGEVERQLLKYRLDSEGKIKVIDLAESHIGNNFGEKKQENNSLTKYEGIRFASGQYRRNKKNLGGKCSIDGSVIFRVPTEPLDTTDEKNYLCTDYSIFGDWSGDVRPDSILVYDIDEFGRAGAAVYLTSNITSIDGEQTPSLIHSVVNGLNNEGENGYVVNIWQNETLKELFMPTTIDVTKSAYGGTVIESTHPLLSAGDIIVYSLDHDGYIANLNVRYDARKGVAAANGDALFNSESERGGDCYYAGQVYSYNADWIGIATNQLGPWIFDTNDIANISFLDAATTNMMVFDCQTGAIRKADKNDVKAYINYGNDAFYAVVCQRQWYTYAIMFYENWEALR